MVHAFNPRSWEAEVDGPLSSRTARAVPQRSPVLGVGVFTQNFFYTRLLISFSLILLEPFNLINYFNIGVFRYLGKPRSRTVWLRRQKHGFNSSLAVLIGAVCSYNLICACYLCFILDGLLWMFWSPSWMVWHQLVLIYQSK